MAGNDVQLHIRGEKSPDETVVQNLFVNIKAICGIRQLAKIFLASTPHMAQGLGFLSDCMCVTERASELTKDSETKKNQKNKSIGILLQSFWKKM